MKIIFKNKNMKIRLTETIYRDFFTRRKIWDQSGRWPVKMKPDQPVGDKLVFIHQGLPVGQAVYAGFDSETIITKEGEQRKKYFIVWSWDTFKDLRTKGEIPHAI